MDAAASTIGGFCLPTGHGERRGKHFGRFSLAAASPEGIRRMEIPGQARDEGVGPYVADDDVMDRPKDYYDC